MARKQPPKRPEKLPDVLGRARELLEQDRYLEKTHAQDQMRARGITRLEVKHVLNTGRHEKRKDQFNQIERVWRYAIRGTTLDEDRDLRVVVAFHGEPERVLVITAIDLDVKGSK